MKKSLFIALLATTILLSFTLSFVSCNSTPKQKPVNPNFLGDFEPFSLGEVMCLATENFGKLKPAQLNLYFSPRTNTIFIRTKVNLNKIEFSTTREDAQKIETAVQKYMETYNSKNFEDRKPTTKNHYDTGKFFLSWGVLGYSRSVDAPYNLNYEIKDSKPYFRIKFEAVDVPDEDNVSSPNIAFYFSPNQLETLFQVADYNEILAKVDELNKATYDFDYEPNATEDTENSEINYEF